MTEMEKQLLNSSTRITHWCLHAEKPSRQLPYSSPQELALHCVQYIKTEMLNKVRNGAEVEYNPEEPNIKSGVFSSGEENNFVLWTGKFSKSIFNNKQKSSPPQNKNPPLNTYPTINLLSSQSQTREKGSSLLSLNRDTAIPTLHLGNTAFKHI